jgi:hypothetical protein
MKLSLLLKSVSRTKTIFRVLSTISLLRVVLLVRLAKLGIEKRDPDTLTDEEKESFARLGKYRTVSVASYFRVWLRNDR